MAEKLKYYSRHELTAEQLKLLEACLYSINGIDQFASDLGGRFAAEDGLSGQNGDYIPAWEFNSSHVEQISAPICWGGEIVPEEGREHTVVGVFPTEILFEALQHAQIEKVNLKVITFKFDRDRGGKDGPATVLALKSAIIYSVDHHGLLSIAEVRK